MQSRINRFRLYLNAPLCNPCYKDRNTKRSTIALGMQSEAWLGCYFTISQDDSSIFRGQRTTFRRRSTSFIIYFTIASEPLFMDVEIKRKSSLNRSRPSLESYCLTFWRTVFQHRHCWSIYAEFSRLREGGRMLLLSRFIAARSLLAYIVGWHAGGGADATGRRRQQYVHRSALFPTLYVYYRVIAFPRDSNCQLSFWTYTNLFSQDYSPLFLFYGSSLDC